MTDIAPIVEFGDRLPHRKTPRFIGRMVRFLRASPPGAVVPGDHLEHPELGLFINSWRTREAQITTGWWKTRVDELTLDNYDTIFGARNSIWNSLPNSFAIALPATIIPIAFAAFAAYGFAWIDFRGRKALFIATVSLLAIPLQVALIPLLQLYVGGAQLTLPLLDKTITLIPDFDLAGNTTAVWLTHTGFAMPFAIFLLHNYISALPEGPLRGGADRRSEPLHDLLAPRAAPVGARARSVRHLPVPLDVERLPDRQHDGRRESGQRHPTTILIANLAGDFGRNEHILPAAAFVQAFIPLVVFFALQRFFVRGMLAGSVKG